MKVPGVDSAEGPACRLGLAGGFVIGGADLQIGARSVPPAVWHWYRFLEEGQRARVQLIQYRPPPSLVGDDLGQVGVGPIGKRFPLTQCLGERGGPIGIFAPHQIEATGPLYWDPGI